MKKILIVIVFVFCKNLLATAQKDSVMYYLNDTLGNATPKSATVEMKGYKINDTLWRGYIYKRRNHKLMLSGLYADSTLKVMQGEYEKFDNDGEHKATGIKITTPIGTFSYQKEGDEIKIDSLFYDNKGRSVKSISITSYYNRKYSLLTAELKGNKNMLDDKWFNPDGNIIKNINFINDTGFKKCYYNNGITSEYMIYYGKKVLKHYYDTAGNEISEKKYNRWRKQNPHYEKPKFNGNFYILKNYIDQHCHDNDSSLKEYSEDKIIIYFLLNQEGKATEITTRPACSDLILSEIKDIFDKYLSWNMMGNKSWPLHWHFQ